MSVKSSKGREHNFTDHDNEVTLRWLECAVESARFRKEERLIALLQIVKAEIIFDIEFASLRNGSSRGAETKRLGKLEAT
ncbi:MAG: hypothetical protein WA982_07375 [Rubrobacteraceae bacterium]